MDIIVYDIPFMCYPYSPFWIRVELGSGQLEKKKKNIFLPFLAMILYLERMCIALRARQEPFSMYIICFNFIFISHWNVIPCSLVDVYQCFGRTCWFNFQGRRVPQGGSSTFFQNLSKYLPDYMMLHPSS